MKKKINLTIDDKLLSITKAYARRKRTSVSELVENHFKVITRPAKKANIIDLVEKLEQSDIDQQADLKELFYNNIKKSAE
jgi:hypothetical protein